MSKIILVTGGSSGIGQAIAARLAGDGHVVYATSRKKTPSSHLPFTLLQMDVTDHASVQSAVDSVVAEQGRLDVLINNAGLGMAGPLESTTDKEARIIFDTNVFGVLNTCRVASRHLRATKGMIINITSIGGAFGLPYRGIYCSSKFAVEGISEALSMELGPHGVRVVIVQPGDFKTNINSNRLNASEIDHSIYPHFQSVLNQVNAEVSSAQDTAVIGKAVSRIVAMQNPKLRYRVATPMQRLSLLLNSILPGRMFERILSKHYGIRSDKA